MPKMIPTIGSVVMARRYYNAKRIIWEPLNVFSIEPEPDFPSNIRICGKWAIDGQRAVVRHAECKELDLKWLDKKILDLEHEEGEIRRRRMNLKATYHTAQSEEFARDVDRS